MQRNHRARARPEITGETPVHVAVRVRKGTWKLRTKRCLRIIREAMIAANAKIRFRITHYSVQGNHLHMMVEADDKYALSRAMRSLSIRIAKRLNALMKERGVRIPTRYHMSVTKTAQDVRLALRYILNNYRRHAADWGEECPPGWVDPYSSGPWFKYWCRPTAASRDPCPMLASGIVEAQSFLLTEAWKAYGLLDPSFVPGPGRF
jgi:REP element-mobilizing transposase RayT